MKTKLIIELETKNMKPIVPEEYIGKVEECTVDEFLTEEIEKQLHSLFSSWIHELIEDSDEGFEWKVLEETELQVEGFDSLSDYGDVKITISDEEIKE